MALVSRLLPQHATRIPSGYAVRHDIAYDYRVGPDDDVVPNFYTGRDNDIHAQPNIVTNADWWALKPGIVVVRIVIGADQSDMRTHAQIITNEDPITRLDVTALAPAGETPAADMELVSMDDATREVHRPRKATVDPKQFLCDESCREHS